MQGQLRSLAHRAVQDLQLRIEQAYSARLPLQEGCHGEQIGETVRRRHLVESQELL